MQERRAAYHDKEKYKQLVIRTKEVDELENIVFDSKMLEAMQYFGSGNELYVRNKNYHEQDDLKRVRMEQIRNNKYWTEEGQALTKHEVIEYFRIYETI